MYAVDDLSDAIDVTRRFLTPIAAATWLKLVVVLFFVSGPGFGGPTVPTGDFTLLAEEPTPTEELFVELPEGVTEADLLVVAAVVLAVVFAIWLVFAVVGAIMEFVLIESLRSETVRIRRYARRNLRRALRLFAFRAILGLAVLLIFAVPAAFVVLTAGEPTAITAGSLVTLGLVAVPLSLGYAIVMRFTTVFVAPVMVLEERGVVSAWRRFWPTFAGSWTEYVVYLVLVWIVRVVVGIAVAFLAVIALLVIGIPFGILAFVLLALGPAGAALAVGVVLLAFVLFLLFVALIEVPVVSYLRYYALLLLGDTESELDLIPDQRAAVRADGGDRGSWNDEDDRDGWNDEDDRDGWNDEDDRDGWNDEDDRGGWDGEDDRDGRENDRGGWDDRDGWDDEDDSDDEDWRW